MTGCDRTGLSSRTCASGLLAIRPSRTAAFSADRSVARTRSTVDAAISVPVLVRWRASRRVDGRRCGSASLSQYRSHRATVYAPAAA